MSHAAGNGARARIGIDGRSIPEAAERGPLGTLDHVSELGLDGIFFRTVTDMSADLDAGLLAEIRSRADALGLYLEAGLGKVNPYMMGEWPQLRRLGDGDVVRGFDRAMGACAEIGCHDLWVGTANFKPEFPGRYGYDRFRTDVTWSEQLEAVRRFLTRLAPIARHHGVRLNLETHEEITSFEIVALIEAVGDDVLGVTFDTANVLRRLEDPVATARRVAPYVRQTHIKDAALTRAEGGTMFQLRTCGLGVVDFAAVLAILLDANPELNLTLETDKMRTARGGPLTMYLESDDPSFRDAHPDLSASEWAAYRRLVDRHEALIAAGERPSNDEWAARPFGYPEYVAALSESVAHLRHVAPARSAAGVSS